MIAVVGGIGSIQYIILNKSLIINYRGNYTDLTFSWLNIKILCQLKKVDNYMQINNGLICLSISTI